jgi:hypothetical protein
VGRKRFLLLVGISAALWAAPSVLAATPVTPAAGAVTGPSPQFTAALAAGDTAVDIQVSKSPQVNVVGFMEKSAYCVTTVSGNRASCSLDDALADGTYYWVLLYEKNTRCFTVGTKRYCLPEPHLTAPVRFTVRASGPPPTPQPTPTPTPTPVPLPPPGGAPLPKDVIARPTNGGELAFGADVEQLYETNDAVIHYVTTGLDAPPLNDDNHDGVPDYVQQIGTAADAALDYYRAHRFAPVPSDSAGPDARPDLYVKHFLDPDLYGVTIATKYAQGGSFVVVSSHLDMSPKLARGSIAITVSHELFHVVQYGYMPDGTLPTWVAEGSATAASMLVYPRIDDLTYADYFDLWLAQPWRPLFDERSYCDHCYGGGLWWAFLMQADPGLMPEYLQRLTAMHTAEQPLGLGVAALDESLRARHDGSLASVFAAFSIAVYREHLDPRPTFALTATHRGSSKRAMLNGLSAHYVPIAVPAGARRVTVHVTTTADEPPHVALIVGGAKGRVVLGTSARLTSKNEREHVVAVITSTGTQQVIYRLTARA